MLNKHFAVLFIVAAFIFGAVAISDAQGPNDAPRYQMQPYGQQLTPQQMEQARQIWQQSYAEMEGTRQALANKRAELDQQLASPNPDRGRIESLSREIGELRGKILSSRADVRSQLAARGLPPDWYGYGPANNGSYGYYGAPCWSGMDGMMGWPGNGWRHHHGHGWRGGCWR